mgnify:CR=1 FL=1
MAVVATLTAEVVGTDAAEIAELKSSMLAAGWTAETEAVDGLSFVMTKTETPA